MLWEKHQQSCDLCWGHPKSGGETWHKGPEHDGATGRTAQGAVGLEIGIDWFFLKICLLFESGPSSPSPIHLQISQLYYCFSSNEATLIYLETNQAMCNTLGILYYTDTIHGWKTPENLGKFNYWPSISLGTQELFGYFIRQLTHWLSDQILPPTCTCTPSLMYCTVLYCTVLYCSIQYCTLHVHAPPTSCTLLYCTVLFYKFTFK